MADVTGAQTTTNVLSDQLAIDLSDRISWLEPDVQVLTVFSRAMGKKSATATKFSWLENRPKARFDTTNGTFNTTVTTIVVDHGTYFQQWDLVQNTRTGEIFRVDSVSTNDLIVTRGIGGTIGTGVAMNDADELYIIGTAQPENDTSKVPRQNIPTKTTNYTQIHRTPFEQSGSLQASSFQVAPAEWDRLAKDAGIEHNKDIELAHLFGKKSLSTPGSTEARTTGGALAFITTNQTDAGGDLSETEFNAFMASKARYASRQNLAMGSATAVSALNKFPASKQQTVNSEKTYGMNVTQYTSPFGSLNLVYHRLLEGTKYGGYLPVVDMDEVKYRPLEGGGVSRDTKVLPNRQPRDQDGTKSEYLTECGLQFGLAEKHGVITGITS